MLLRLLLLLLLLMMMILREDTKIDTCKSFGLRRRVFAHLLYITSHFSNLTYSCLEGGGSCFFQTLVLYTTNVTARVCQPGTHPCGCTAERHHISYAELRTV